MVDIFTLKFPIVSHICILVEDRGSTCFHNSHYIWNACEIELLFQFLMLQCGIHSRFFPIVVNFGTTTNLRCLVSHLGEPSAMEEFEPK